MVETALALPAVVRPGLLSRVSSWWSSRRSVVAPTVFAAEVAPAPRLLGRGAPRDTTNAWPLWLSSGLTPDKLRDRKSVV